MRSTSETAASDEVGHLSGLSRQELADEWVNSLKAARDMYDLEPRGRGGRWAAIGRDPRVREVEREFMRRMIEWEYELELYLARGSLGLGA